MIVSKEAAILLVEDDEKIRSLAEATLTLAGYHVVTARDGVEAMAELPRLRPRLLLSDLRMPRCDGWQLLQWVRARPEYDHMPVILVSALNDTPHVRHGMALGADDYVTKPYDPEDLLATITARLERTSRLEESRREVGKFLARVLPHELRTPLAGVLGYAELLIMAAATGEAMAPSQIHQYGENIQRAGRRLLGLAEDLSLWSELENRLEEGGVGQPGGDVWLAPAELEWRLRERARHHGREADLSLRIDGALLASLPPGLADVARHLVDNALKFSPPGSLVEVRGRIAVDAYVFNFVDQGPGLAPEQMAMISVLRQFGREQLEQQGMGLGLVLARSFARLARGEFELVNNPGGRGLTARLSLPLAQNRMAARVAK